jgi:hypothetical protein
VAIRTDRNGKQKEPEKELKYNSLCVEIQRMWNMKCMVISQTTGATVKATKGLKKTLEGTRGKHSTEDSCTCDITHNAESTAV